MAAKKTTTKKETVKSKTMVKKTVKKDTVKTSNKDITTEAIKETFVNHEDVKKPIVKREALENPVLKGAKKGLKDFKGKYIEGVGRRKTSIARVRFYLNESGFSANGRDLETYFQVKELQDKLVFPLRLTNTFNKFGISIKVIGGGYNSQCDACILGISRCLIKYDPEFRPILKKNGLLTRDSRIVERKKYGLHKARRAPQ
jgi:small subunit ribosomal protein S9